jgi:uncharacterized protein (TIGR03000 family)
MYSAVLMLALTAGGETADFGRNRCNSACSSSCSHAVAGCSSSCGHSRGGLFHRCSSSCSTGCARSHGSHGCSSACSSSCSRGGLFSHRNRCSCAPACSTVVVGCACSGTTTGGEKKPLPGGEKKPMGEELKKPKGSVQSSAPATIVVTLPADARLTVDGMPTNSLTERRTLLTPELQFGETYVYTLRAEIVREGRTEVQSHEVNVRGGETSTVQFQFQNQGVASR